MIKATVFSKIWHPDEQLPNDQIRSNVMYSYQGWICCQGAGVRYWTSPIWSFWKKRTVKLNNLTLFEMRFGDNSETILKNVERAIW